MNEYTEKYKRLYENDKRFRDYVDAYCKKHKLKTDAAFDHVVVRSCGDYYLSNPKGGTRQ